MQFISCKDEKNRIWYSLFIADILDIIFKFTIMWCVLISECIWVQMTLEEAIGYVASDELIEVSSTYFLN